MRPSNQTVFYVGNYSTYDSTNEYEVAFPSLLHKLPNYTGKKRKKEKQKRRETQFTVHGIVRGGPFS